MCVWSGGVQESDFVYRIVKLLRELLLAAWDVELGEI